jgi:hypothetical protein
MQPWVTVPEKGYADRTSALSSQEAMLYHRTAYSNAFQPA